jgi:peptidyl-prolyl cis-trans isomerase A (cyclophilin A)
MRSSRLLVAATLALGLVSTSIAAAAEKLTITLAGGDVVIELADDVAPQHAARLKALADAGEYDNVAFHRVIDGFMAQTGDVEFGDMKDGFVPNRAGMGGSSQPDLNAEFSDIPFERGTVGMARSQNPNSANSQFFIMFAPAPHLNGEYTVVGKVIEGMELVDQIKRGAPGSGAVQDPDRMIKVRSGG